MNFNHEAHHFNKKSLCNFSFAVLHCNSRIVVGYIVVSARIAAIGKGKNIKSIKDFFGEELPDTHKNSTYFNKKPEIVSRHNRHS
jgi:hypothetical protein